MENKLVICILGQNCEKFIGMCLDSVKDADAIVFVDGGSVDRTKEIVKGYSADFIYNRWDKEDLQMNGKARNVYLNYIKQKYKDWWCLVLDADELVEDLSKIKEFMQKAKAGIYNVKMRHFIGSLGSEDATQPVHICPARLFKISEAKGYPLHSHPILEGELMGACLDTVIWHCGHLPILYLDYLKNRYLQHKKDSIIHTSEFLESWYLSHITGHYPAREINILDLPKQLCERYLINKDKFYFQNRGLEVKHFIMMKQFQGITPVTSVLDLGCGLGPYGEAIRIINDDIEYIGIEKSKWAVENTPFKKLNIRQGDITSSFALPDSNYDLVLCLDILEHLEEKDLDGALRLISSLGKNFIFSIPFLGDPNLEADSTHKIKQSRFWWMKKLEKYCNIKMAPKEWLFSHQLLIGEKK